MKTEFTKLEKKRYLAVVYNVASGVLGPRSELIGDCQNEVADRPPALGSDFRSSSRKEL